jgi:acetolactate synthase-1/2/3 large subunit
MNCAQSLIRTPVDAGVEVCFANPGTSEMHFVAALDSVPDMRGVLGLFEGVVTGAADGYGRIAGKPAATLLHLGPGLGNGLANLHNARRAHTPVVSVVGDHATYHKKYDAPLESDIDAVAGSLQGWVRRSGNTAEVGADAAAAVAAAQGSPGRVATLILPADVSWDDGGVPVGPVPPQVPLAAVETTVKTISEILRTGEPVALLAGGPACREAGLRAISRIAAATGARPLIETFPARLERDAGLPTIERLAYLAEQAIQQLDGVAHVILAGANAAVSFFAYPGKGSVLVPKGAQVHTLAKLDHDVVGALEALADEVAADTEPLLAQPQRHVLPSGPLTAQNWAEVIGALLPEGAIISDEANTSGWILPAATERAPRHDLLTLTGGRLARACPWPPALPWPPRTARSSPCSPTAAPSTPFPHSGPKHAKTSTSPPCCSTTGLTPSFGWSCSGSAPRVPAPKPTSCSTCPTRTWTSSRSPKAWASRPPVRPPPRNSPTSSAAPPPNPAPTSSMPRSHP